MPSTRTRQRQPSWLRRALGWLGARDPGFAALRRAGRAALVMPAMFALGFKLLGNPTLGTFAAFGSFAMLLLVDFSGPMRERLQAQAALALVGGLFVSVGTLVSRSTWAGALAMALVGFAVLFAGIVSSVLAAASVALLLAFILPVSIAGPDSSIPSRLAGWFLAAAAALIAIRLLWPAPTRDRLRQGASAACRALAARLHSDAALLTEAAAQPSAAEREAVLLRANEAAQALQRTFFATPYRPTGLSTAARTVVRLVDELNWLQGIVAESPTKPEPSPNARRACGVTSAAAVVLERGADLLDAPGDSPERLRTALATLHEALAGLERATTLERPGGTANPLIAALPAAPLEAFVSSLEPSFRAQELSFVVSQIALNIDLSAAAERRSWLERLLGRQPAGLPGPLEAAQQRAASHVERHSVWLHNSVRGAIGLALAVLVADLSNVQHAFWVVLGALSVLRSNALSTGQNVVRGLLGTLAGFVVGAGLLAAIGANATVLWFLLPLAVLFAGFAPAAVSFAAGQAAFTLALVILFNLVQPSGWRVGLVRIEDVALGCAVSLVVGLLFWPRGAAAAFGQALAEAYGEAARYLAAAVRYGLGRCDAGMPALEAPAAQATSAAAAARRLDDAFRGFLAERGAKQMPLAQASGLVSGAAGLRLAADAVLELWRPEDARGGGERARARNELLARADALAGWYDAFAAGLAGHAPLPEPLPRDEQGDGRLVDAVRGELESDDPRANAVAVRMIWTGDHLDAARRLQGALVRPASAAGASGEPPVPRPWFRLRVRQPSTASGPPAG